MDYAEISETLRTAMVFGKDLLSLKVSGDDRAKIAEMNDAMLAAQTYAIAAQQREMDQTSLMRTLEEEVERLMSWTAQKEDYEIKSLGNTAFVYVVKESVETSEPPFWLCQPCFENAKKSILQMRTRLENRLAKWACPLCKSEISVAPGTYP